jgi:hydrogenase nickel incorporation protein HypB
MIHHALDEMKPEEDSILFIENVGNLVCPAMFDLGEKERVVIISVTEGDDKPLKYPFMFNTSTLCIINKIDLLPYVSFSMENLKEYATRINPRLQFIELSCTNGEGLATWYQWLIEKIAVTAME